MGDYAIWQCRQCGSGCVRPLPSPEALAAFYQGFLTNLEAGQYPRYLAAAGRLFPHLGLRPRGRRLLDVGGGGGFFSKAFEALGYGESTYVDLDPQSCEFARKELGLARVLNCDALQVREHVPGGFDLIYCRHLIEHLRAPTLFLERMAAFLGSEGRLVAQCPNGDSLEYLAYPRLLRGRRERIQSSNGVGAWAVLLDMVRRGMLHGIDPPRHLWAITGRGLRRWAAGAGLACRVYARPLWDLAYSPAYVPRGVGGFAQSLAGNLLFAPWRGGTHLVGIIGRSSGGKQA